jgi:hypothetical protein
MATDPVDTGAYPARRTAMDQSSSNGRPNVANERVAAPLRLHDPEPTKEAWDTHAELIEEAEEKVRELHGQLERMRASRQAARATVARSRQLRREARLARDAFPPPYTKIHTNVHRSSHGGRGALEASRVRDASSRERSWWRSQ